MTEFTQGNKMQNNAPLVSVIIPVYKVEKCLNRCVDSVRNQTYKNIEIILVDDGSPDNCGKICDEYAKKDNRVVVIHKENGGLSSARNAGVAACHGEYVSFVDSDDYISADYVEYLYCLIKENNADIGVGRYVNTCDDNVRLSYNIGSGETVFSGKEAMIAMTDNRMDDCRLTIACCKLFKHSIVVNSPFPVGRYHEDEAVAHKMLYEANVVVLGDKAIYAYYRRNDSITGKTNAVKQCDYWLAILERAEFMWKINERNMATKMFNWSIRNALKTSLKWDRALDKMIFDVCKKNRFKRCFPLKARAYVLSYKISPKLFLKIKKYM